MMITWNRRWCHANVMWFDHGQNTINKLQNFTSQSWNDHAVVLMNDDEFSKNTLSWSNIVGIYHSHKIKHIRTIVWQWSFQQYGTTMTWHCFFWTKSLSERQETIVRILLLHITANFHAHNYVLFGSEYAWQPTNSGHESRAHVYYCSPWSRVCWSWWPQSKALLTMVS